MINQKEGRCTPGKWFPTPGEIHRRESNKAIFESTYFKEACDRASVDVTKRQASKFRSKKGRAYAARASK